jgi:L-ascorbate metabolism protein UlaG (beta-lactamase superfamily)
LIEPALADDAFLADVEAAPAAALHLWWLGQSGFLVKGGGRHLLLDPYLSDSLTKKYEATETPHVRITRRVVDPARLAFVDTVTASHSHTDHLDAETLQAIRPHTLVCPAGTRELARERAGIEPLGVEEGQTVEVEGFAVTAVRAEHDAPGGALGYIVQVAGRTLYHSGDTVAFEGLAESLRAFALDLAILPINGKLGNIAGADAARIAKQSGAALAVPCHFDMFELNTAAPDEFVQECERLGQPCHVLRVGKRLTVTGRTRAS